MGAFTDRLAHAWNAFVNQDRSEHTNTFGDWGHSYSTKPHMNTLSYSNEKSIIASIYTRLGIDLGAVKLRHVKLDDAGRYLNDVNSGLNNCLTVEANVDQIASAFRQDIAMTLFDEGVAAIVAVDTTLNPRLTGGYDVKTLRVGTIKDWYPRHVRVNVYNDRTGKREDIVLPKTEVAIVENPLYAVMNEPNSTLKRLIKKLNLLDTVDEAAGSGKLDIIIQLPYVVKSETRRQQANQRRKDIETQLRGSKYGIAYTDGTENITQLNRPAENNLLKQIEYLHVLLYAQLGLTEEVMNGTADEKTMLNYTNRTIKPIVNAISEAMHRTFLSKTARSQKQAVRYFNDPFSLVPINDIAEIADKFTRNEILTGNEIRQIVGFAPSSDPRADELRNSNMPDPNPEGGPPPRKAPGGPSPEDEGDNQNGS